MNNSKIKRINFHFTLYKRRNRSIGLTLELVAFSDEGMLISFVARCSHPCLKNLLATETFLIHFHKIVALTLNS